jgi:hypothetical protein
MEGTAREPVGEPAHELALRYLLELSADIRSAHLVDAGGELIAAAPETPSERAASVSGELAREARALAGNRRSSIEVDVTVDGGAVFLVYEGGSPALICVAGRFALPGLVLHDMRTVLSDIRQGGATGSAR